jgi:DNA-directed RNA polymerase III subunit RPC1
MKEEVVDQTPKRMFAPCKTQQLTNSAQLKFETFSPQQIVKNGVVELTNRDLYLIQETSATERVPAPHGALDLRLVENATNSADVKGSSVKTGTCETCGLSQQHCIGHFGHVKLSLPVFHIGYFKNTLTICQCICKVLSFGRQTDLRNVQGSC